MIIPGKHTISTKYTWSGGSTLEIQYACPVSNAVSIGNAAGRKLKKIPSTGNAKTYVGGIEYSGSAIEAIYHPEGRARLLSSTWEYEYAVKDHLGNARVYFKYNGSISFLQENHYYPFGMEQGGWTTPTSPENKYKYNGKEYNDDFSLGLYDYGARWYDPTIGRWTSVDPLAEKMAQCSPFNYVLNNPIRLNDPDGNAPEDIIITGSMRFKQQAFNNLQKLTNTPLVLLENGKVVQSNSVLPFTPQATFIPLTTKGSEGSVENIAGTNLPKPKLNGSDLVIDLINSSKDITIQETKGGNQSTASSIEANIQADGSNGRGSNATVEFNPSNSQGGVDIKGNRNRPTQIGLGHELIHARHYATGSRNPSSSGVLDPDGSGMILSNEERNTRMDENNLRREQGVSNRKIN